MNVIKFRVLGAVAMLAMGFSPSAAGDGPPVPRDPSALMGKNPPVWQIGERDMHSQVWESSSSHIDPRTGKVMARKTRFAEIGTGINFQDEQGNWQATREEFLLTPEGYAVAEFGPHKLTVGNNINSDTAIDFFTSDGMRVRNGPLAIAYYDPVDGRNIVLATVRNTAGVKTAPNEITFPSAFDDMNASIRITYKRAGMSADLILHEAPPAPEVLGLSTHARLEFYTQFHPESPMPQQKIQVFRSEPDPAIRANMVSPDITDAVVDYGRYKMGPGTAFEWDGAAGSERIPVVKQYQVIDGQSVLIEAVEYREAKKLLAALPPAKNLDHAKLVQAGRLFGAAAPLLTARHLPERKPAIARVEPIQQAKAAFTGQGCSFLIDYSLVTGETNKTFQANWTYFVNSDVYLYGKTVFESSVFKYTNTGPASLRLLGPAEFQTTALKPVVFTSQSDDTIGETLPWSSGNPTTNYCADPALYFDYYVSSNLAAVQNIRVSHARAGVSFYTGHGHVVKHSSFVGCNSVFQPYYATVDFQNILVDRAGILFSGSPPSTGVVHHLTAHQVGSFKSSSDTTILLTNSILAAVTNTLYGTPFAGEPNVWLTDASGIFQEIGAGKFYLLDDTYRNLGLLEDPILTAELALRTTLPPLLLTNTVTESTNLAPVVEADNDGIFDLGFHYPRVDFAANAFAVTNDSTVAIAAGTVIATYGITAIWLRDGSKLVSEGTPNERNQFVRFNAVQEQSTNWGGADLWNTLTIHPYHSSNRPAAAISLRFTDFNAMPGEGRHLYSEWFDEGEWSYGSLSVKDCSFTSGSIWLSGTPTAVFAFTNNVFERLNDANFLFFGKIYAYNNLFYGGGVYCLNFDSTWAFHDNVFHAVNLSDDGATTNSHNVFVGMAGRLQPTNATSITLSAYSFTNGPLGRYYQDASNLFDNGSQVASAAGLFHYTTRPNSMKETNSVVDRGLHYVAVDTNGVPVDSDGDALILADYIEDRNGNGAQDLGETSFQAADTDGDGVSDFEEICVYGTQATSVDSDGDLLMDGDEILLYSTSPHLTDTDLDGLNDRAELIIHFTNPLLFDTDGDDVNDGDEVVHQTNPLLIDSDGDGILDFAELFVMPSNPSNTDSDNDGTPDGADLSYSSLDTDADGVPDAWALAFGISGDGTADADQDGSSNLQEYQRGTNPILADTDKDGILDGVDTTPLISAYAADYVWVDDALPTGGIPFASGDAWRWLSSTPLPVSGNSNHVSWSSLGTHERGFTNASVTLIVNSNDVLTTWVYVYPNNFPKQILLEWFGMGGTNYRASWGSDFIVTGPRQYMGPMPVPGKWTRLDVPASLLGVHGQALHGIRFALYDGWAAWDRTGKFTGDSDGDALPDEWERMYWGNLSQGSTGDADGDGLTNLGEMQNGGNPTLTDTDGDGLTDWQEIQIGTRPDMAISPGNFVVDGMADADKDGLINKCEFYAYSTHPTNAYSQDLTLVATDAEMKLTAFPGQTVTPLQIQYLSGNPPTTATIRLTGATPQKPYLILVRDLASSSPPHPFKCETIVTPTNSSIDVIIDARGRSIFNVDAFAAGLATDSDVNEAGQPDPDGLLDAYEVLITKTSPDTRFTKPELADNQLDYDGNGINNFQQAVMDMKVSIHASDPYASELGNEGELTVTLPRPAGAGGATVNLYLLPPPEGTFFKDLVAFENSLVAHWKLDESSGTRIDSHGGNNLGDINAVASASGKLGNAASFSGFIGDGECLNIGDNAALSMGDIDFTIAFWVWFDDLGMTGLVGKWAAGSLEYIAYFDGQNLRFHVSNDGSANISVINPEPISTGTWYFYVASHDATANTINLSVNNKAPATASHSTGVHNGGATFYVGRNEEGETWLPGRVDSVSIWKRLLTSAERGQLYNSGYGLGHPFVSVALAYPNGSLINIDRVTRTASVSIPQGASTARIRVLPVDNSDPPPAGTVVVQMKTPPPAGFLSSELDLTPTTIIVEDDELPTGVHAGVFRPTVTVELVYSDARERLAAPRNGEVKFRRNLGNARPLTVSFRLSGTAKPVEDYLVEASGLLLGSTMTIPAGADWAEVLIKPIRDGVEEFRENIVLTIEPRADYVVGSAASAEIWLDDEGPNSYIVSTLLPRAIERIEVGLPQPEPANNNRPGAFQVQRKGPVMSASPAFPGEPASLNGATFGVDYTAKYDAPPVGPPGQSGVQISLAAFNSRFLPPSVKQYINVTPIPDLGADGPEAVSLTAFGQIATLHIYDRPPAQEPVPITITSIAALATEGNATQVAKFRIQRLKLRTASPWTPYVPGQGTTDPNARSLVVYFDVAGTATIATDYSLSAGTAMTAPSSRRRTVVLPFNTLSVDVTVTAVSDAITEPVESIVVTLAPEANYSMTTRRVALRVRDSAGNEKFVPDTDNDGVDDIAEITNSTNPLLADSDGNGLPDSFPASSSGDWDKDGMQNINEFALGLIRTDSDGDGLSDSREISLRTNPFNSLTVIPLVDADAPSIGSLTAPIEHPTAGYRAIRQ